MIEGLLTERWPDLMLFGALGLTIGGILVLALSQRKKKKGKKV